MVVVTMAMVIVGVRERALCVYARLPGLRSGRKRRKPHHVDGRTERRELSSPPCLPVRDAVNIDPPSLNTPRYSLPQAAAAAESTSEP